MSCIIKIQAGNNQIEVEVPSLPSSLSELKKVLSQNKKLTQFNSYIRTAVSQGNILGNKSLKTIKDSGKIIPNTTALSVQLHFPTVVFPKIDLQKLPILLVNHYNTVNNELQFGIIEQNEEQVYILDNDIEHIKKFANYLSLKNAIEQDNFLNKLDKKSQKLLEEIRQITGYSSKEEMILQYLTNKNIFRNFRTLDGKSIFSILNNFLVQLGQITPRQISFQNNTVQEFYNRLSFSTQDDKKITIPFKELYEQVLIFDDSIKEVLPNTFEKFKKFINSNETNERFSSLFGESEDKLNAIIEYLNNLEPWLNLKLDKEYNGTLYFKQLFPSINRVYNIGFDTIKSMTHSDYKGWYIFEDTGKFYPSKTFLNPNTRTKQLDSIEEAKALIEEQINKEELFGDTKLEYGRRRVNNSYIEGSLVRIKDYEVSGRDIQNEKEKNLKTLQEFYSYFNSPEIQQLIQNAEEATLFLRKINEFTDRSLNKLIEIAQEIHDAPYTYYYIEKSYKDSKDNKYQRVIPAKGESIEEFQQNYRTPVIQLFNAAQEVFGNKFGIQMEILSNDEIEEQYNVTNAKAFIVGDKIILNSTLASSDDLFHEYSHIVLGYLKNKNLEVYRELIQTVWNALPSFTINYINNQYKNLPMESKMEEGFVYQFGKYISDGLINEDLSKIFKASESLIQDGVSSIFDGETDIQKVFGTKLNTIFGRFNQEIGNLLNSDDDFLSFSKSNEFFLQRKKTNWLEKQIELKNIKEEC